MAGWSWRREPDLDTDADDSPMHAGRVPARGVADATWVEEATLGGGLGRSGSQARGKTSHLRGSPRPSSRTVESELAALQSSCSICGRGNKSEGS